MKFKSIIGLNFVVLLGAALVFVPFLGAVHLFDWDEINFAESAREMLLTGEYFRVQINFQPFWEKPPLFIWMQALSMSFFGVNEFAARLPNALIGIVTILVLFNLGRKHFDLTFGFFWALIYAGSFLPHLYFKSGIIDPTFNLFIFLGLYFLSQIVSTPAEERGERNVKIMLAALFTGLAILTKGPVALLVIMISALIYFIIKKSFSVFSFRELILFFAVAGLISFTWFGVETLKNGPWFLKEFITYQIRLLQTQDAGHGGPFFYHWLVLYLGCFPASVFIFNSFKRNYADGNDQRSLKLWMIISLFVVLIIFSLVKTKIIHYSSFCYFPLTFLAAYSLQKLHIQKNPMRKYFYVQVLILGTIISLALIAFPLLLKFKDELLPYITIKDDFALANLEANVYWNGWEAAIGFFYLFVILTFYFKRNSGLFKSAIILFSGTLITVELALIVLVPKIERFSQGAAIDFYKSMEGKDVYLDIYGFKSYGQLFYSKKQISQTLNIDSVDWLRKEPFDKTVYLVSKITNRDLSSSPLYKKIGSKNGFDFYQRIEPILIIK